jgi:predicted HTH transcriptional regulator
MMQPMRRDLPTELQALILRPRETRAVEYKASMSWGEARQKVVKTALAMANLDDGGYIVFGVSEPGRGQFEPAGMSEVDYESFIPDEVNDQIRLYADPPFAVSVYHGTMDSRLFLVIAIPPFADLPIICRRDGGTNSELREGAIYTRSIHKPETTEIRSVAEMRELLDRAVDVQVARLRRRLPGLLEPPADDRELFHRERGRFE